VSAYQAQEGLTPEARMVVIEEIVGDLKQRLYGNGQPGDIESMKARISKIEQWMWRAIGGGLVIAFVFERLAR
jgi:hypothetical protein